MRERKLHSVVLWAPDQVQFSSDFEQLGLQPMNFLVLESSLSPEGKEGADLLRATGMPSEAQTWRKVSAFWTPLGRKVGPAQGSHPYSGLYGDVVVSF